MVSGPRAPSVFVGGNLAGVTDRRKEQEPMDSDFYPRAEWKLFIIPVIMNTKFGQTFDNEGLDSALLVLHLPKKFHAMIASQIPVFCTS